MSKKTGIHVGNNLAPKQQDNLTKSIVAILQSGHKYHHDQETVRHALDIVKYSNAVNNVSISNSTVGLK